MEELFSNIGQYHHLFDHFPIWRYLGASKFSPLQIVYVNKSFCASSIISLRAKLKKLGIYIYIIKMSFKKVLRIYNSTKSVANELTITLNDTCCPGPVLGFLLCVNGLFISFIILLICENSLYTNKWQYQNFFYSI